ncbi:hypothetical protein AAEP93_011153 [Penicillium crustosum]
MLTRLPKSRHVHVHVHVLYHVPGLGLLPMMMDPVPSTSGASSSTSTKWILDKKEKVGFKLFMIIAVPPLDVNT